jgi:tetratricopeptide (TPR) repeat protein
MANNFLIVFLFLCECAYSQNKSSAEDYFKEANNVSMSKGDGTVDSVKLLRSISLYSRAILKDEKYWAAYRNRARLYMRFNRYQEAISDLTLALKYRSYKINAELLRMRSECYYTLKYYKEAINDYNMYLSVMSNQNYIIMCRAKAYWMLGNKKKACEDYNIAIKANPKLKKDADFLKCD